MRNQKVTDLLNMVLVETGCDKQTAISIVIIGLVEAGLKIDAATDLVLGPGTFRKIADEVWAMNRGVSEVTA